MFLIWYRFSCAIFILCNNSNYAFSFHKGIANVIGEFEQYPLLEGILESLYREKINCAKKLTKCFNDFHKVENNFPFLCFRNTPRCEPSLKIALNIFSVQMKLLREVFLICEYSLCLCYFVMDKKYAHHFFYMKKYSIF